MKYINILLILRKKLIFINYHYILRNFNYFHSFSTERGISSYLIVKNKLIKAVLRILNAYTTKYMTFKIPELRNL